MTEAMPFLQKAILLSYDPRPLGRGIFKKQIMNSFHSATEEVQWMTHHVLQA